MTYVEHTRRLLTMLRAVADADHNPRTLAAALDVSQPTIYRMLNEVGALGARVEWDGAAYRVRDWGVLAPQRVKASPRDQD